MTGFSESAVQRPLVSVVIPCFNEEEVIGETVRRLRKLCDELTDFRTELIFVDDGSRDHTRALLRQAAAINMPSPRQCTASPKSKDRPPPVCVWV